LTEDQAIEKIKQIEQKVRDALLVETTTIRTKNTVTIASRYPVRHVQIVLRIYKSISEILTGFDVDCSCAAYDGKQVYASPRALAAYMTQVNTVDLTRRSPSYENRLSKYAQRGFEVYWPSLDRSRIDPTIFERSFTRTEGLARLLILEKLPKSQDREAYLDQRRAERGRPAANRSRMRKRLMPGNIKNDYENEVAEWVDDEDVSAYHSITIPYGPKYHARKIEKLLFTKDLLLNSEWNKPKDREVNLHRHPAFFGTVDDVIHDCCGYCPKPATIDEEEVAEEENKVFISGDISFMKDDPGRQAIGSFNPLTADDWTTMAYVGNTALLCQAIVDGDFEYVQSWLQEDGNDPNTRDFTGRAPLHLAVTNSTLEIVQALIDHGARLISRLVDGKTALHLAAIRGRVDIVSALLRKSEANEEEEEKKIDARRAARKAAKDGSAGDVTMQDADKTQPTSTHGESESDIEMIEQSEADEDENMDRTTGSMVDIRHPPADADDQVLAKEEKEDEPDVYDINVTAWDTAVSPLHLAIAKGYVDVVKCLVQDFGADILLPIKLFNDHDRSAKAAILTLVLALQLPAKEAEQMARTLIQLGASSAQASVDQTTALQYCVADTPDLLDTLGDADMAGVMRAINHLSVNGYRWYVYHPQNAISKSR
jgi:ankyrin repeat protein